MNTNAIATMLENLFDGQHIRPANRKTATCSSCARKFSVATTKRPYCSNCGEYICGQDGCTSMCSCEMLELVAARMRSRAA